MTTDFLLTALLFGMLFFCPDCNDGYPNVAAETPPAAPMPLDETERAREIVDVLMQSYLEGANEQQQQQYQQTAGLPPSVVPAERFAKEESTDFSSGGSLVRDLPTPPLYLSPAATLDEDNQVQPIEVTNETAIYAQREQEPDSAALLEGHHHHPMGPLDPGSLTLTLIIVAAVICAISLITLTAFSVWQYRRRHNSSQWIVGKSKLPAYQGDAWCYENVTADANTMKKNRDSIYLASATLKPYAYADSLPTSNGTTRSSALSSDSERRPSPYFDGWNAANGQLQYDGGSGGKAYREKLVN